MHWREILGEIKKALFPGKRIKITVDKEGAKILHEYYSKGELGVGPEEVARLEDAAHLKELGSNFNLTFAVAIIKHPGERQNLKIQQFAASLDGHVKALVVI